MRVPSRRFPGTGLHEYRCDYCKGPIIMGWPGRDGEYCSNECLEKKERQKMPEGEEQQAPIITTPASESAKEKKENKVKKQRSTAAPKKGAKKKGAPKATKKKASKTSSGELFRPGTVMARIFKVLSDGAVHKREELHKITDAADVSRQLIYMVIKHCKGRGGMVAKTTRDTVQVSKKRKAA